MDQGLNLDRGNMPAPNGGSNLLDSLLANASGTSTHNIQGTNSQQDPFHDFGHGCIPIYSRHVSTPSIPDQSPPVFGRSSIGVRMRFGLGGMSIEASMGHPGHTGSGPMLFMTSPRRNQSSRFSPFGHMLGAFGPMSGPFGQHMPGPFGQMPGPFGPMPGLFGQMSSPFGFPAFPFPPFGDIMSPHNTRDPFEETPFRTTQASCQNFSSNANEDEHYSGPIITEIFDDGDDDDDEGRDDIAVVDNSDDDDGNTSQTDEDDLFGLTDNKRLNSDDLVQLVEMMKQTDDYLPSDKGYEEPVYVDRKFEEGSQSIEPGVQQPIEKKLDETDAAPDQHVHSNANNEDKQTEKPTSKMKRSFRTQDFVDMPLFFGDMMMSSSESKPEHVEHTSNIPNNEDEKLSEINTHFSDDKPGSEQSEFKSKTSASLKDTKPTYENVEASDMPNEMTGDGNNEHEQPGLNRKIHSIDTTSTQSTVEAALAESHHSDRNSERKFSKSRSYEQDINGPDVAPRYNSPADIAKSGVLPEHSNEQNVDTSNADWRKAASQTETIHVRESPIVWDGDNTGDSIPNISKVETTSSEKPSQSFTHSASQFSDVSRSQKPSPVNSYSNLKWCYPGQAMKQGAGKYQNPAPGSWDASFADKNRQGQDHPANAWASHGNSDFDSLDDHALKEEALYLKQPAEQRIALREQHFQGSHGKTFEKDSQHSSSPGHIPESFNQFHHCQENSCPSCNRPMVPVCHHHHHHQHCGHVYMDSTEDEHWELNEHWQCHSFEDNKHVHGHSCGHVQVPPYGGQCHHTGHQHCNHHGNQYGHRQGHNPGRFQPEGRANVHADGESCAAQLDSTTPVKQFRNKNASVRRRKTSSEPPTEQNNSSGSYTSNRIKGNSEITNAYGHYNHREAFDALIESVGLQRKDVFTDGNCLFTAITDQLRIRGDFSFTAKTLRSAAVDYLKKNPNQDDGTPLFEFLDELEGNWDEYLTKMSRDGHWGDHIVIHALAHVLNRRIIIYRGNGELVKTVVEPRGNVTDNKNDISDETPVEEESKEKDEEPQTVTLDEMYLGHESESHYVSLRPLDWRDKLIEELRTKSTSCLFGCNSSTMNIDTNGNTTPTRCAPNYTSYDANFILNYILRGNFIHPNNIMYWRGEQPMASSQYLPDMLEMNTFVSSSGTSRSYRPQPKTYIISPSDTKVVLHEHGAHQRDLVVLTEGVPVGKLRLKSVKPSLWVPLTVSEMNTCVIRHASVTNHDFKEIRPQDEIVLGFKAEWPPEADEWKSRKRASGWPDEALIGKILRRPVYVTHSKEHGSASDGTIWEYNFKEAERLLSLDIRNVSGLFLILNKMVKLVFSGTVRITNEHVKSAILYLLEKFTTEEIERSPATSVLDVITAMLEYLKSGHFPCYFIRGKNLIAGLDYTERSWHIDRLNMLKKHFLVCLYFVIDREKLNACFGFEKIVCGLTEAALGNQDVGSGEDLDIVSRHGQYVTLAIIAIQQWISRSHFTYAREKLSTWLSDLRNNYNLHELSKERFLDFVLASLYGVDKWLLAFNMDLEDGTNTLKGVCEGQECANISLMFGDDVVPLLQKETSFKSDILSVPTSIMLGSRLTLFACKLQHVLEEAQCEEDAYQAAFHCFLKNNTHDLLLSVDKDRKEQNCSANVTLGDLKKLFDGLYTSYCGTENIDKFRELMDLYEEFCNVYESETEFKFLSSLWRWFNEPERAEAADMKADLVKTGNNESYV